VHEPTSRTDEYSGHQIRCEELVRESPQPWAIYRFGDVPPNEARRPHPTMFAIPLDNRIELVHRDDAGPAVANGVSADIWGRTWLIGGGPSCQVRYRDMLGCALAAFALGALPDSAFSTDPYCTDWLDTEESQRVPPFQRHSFDDIMAYVVEHSRPPLAARLVLPLVRSLARRQILKLSPHFKALYTGGPMPTNGARVPELSNVTVFWALPQYEAEDLDAASVVQLSAFDDQGNLLEYGRGPGRQTERSTVATTPRTSARSPSITA
jgi:hypothetical protein